MSKYKICAICGKGSMLLTPHNKLRGKYNPAEKKRKYPNLQWVRILVSKNKNGKGVPVGTPGVPFGKSYKRVKACVQCIKTLSKLRKK